MVPVIVLVIVVQQTFDLMLVAAKPLIDASEAFGAGWPHIAASHRKKKSQR